MQSGVAYVEDENSLLIYMLRSDGTGTDNEVPESGGILKFVSDEATSERLPCCFEILMDSSKSSE